MGVAKRDALLFCPFQAILRPEDARKMHGRIIARRGRNGQNKDDRRGL